MANQAEKRRYENNRRRLNRLFGCILFANVWYIVVRLVVRSATAFWFNYLALVTSNTVYLPCYAILKNAAKPQYSSSNELTFGGMDLAMAGFAEYLTDAILLTAVVQVLGAPSDWAWILALIAPGYGLYVAWTYYSQLKGAQKQHWENMGLGKQSTKTQRRLERRQARGR